MTRMVTDPTSGTAPAAGAVVTIGWGGVSRLDLEPAGCQDPQAARPTTATEVLASDDFSIRASATADGPDAVAQPVGLRRVAVGRTGRSRRSSSSRPMAAVPSSTWCRPSGRRSVSSTGPTRTDSLVLPEAPAYVVFLVDGLGRLLERYAEAAPYLSTCSTSQQPGTCGVPSTTAPQP